MYFKLQFPRFFPHFCCTARGDWPLSGVNVVVRLGRQQFMAIHQFSVSRNSQATKSTRNRRIFQCCVKIPVVNIVDIFAACESQIFIPHTTLGTFNLLCLSKDWHRTELNRLRKQSEIAGQRGCLMRARMLYSRIGADLGVLSCLFGGCIARGDFETAPCLL